MIYSVQFESIISFNVPNSCTYNRRYFIVTCFDNPVPSSECIYQAKTFFNKTVYSYEFRNLQFILLLMPDFV